MTSWELGLSGVFSVTGPKGTVEVDIKGEANKSNLEADLGNKLDYQFGNAGGNQHNVDRTRGLAAEMEKLGFKDNIENRLYFEEYYNNVLYDPNNIISIKQQSYTSNGVNITYGATYRESFLMGQNGGAQVTTVWDGNRLLTIIIKSGEQTRYSH